MGHTRRRIDLWYGSRQQTCAVGQPQRWYNVLGRVEPAAQVVRMIARTDSGVYPLTLGPDGRRLVGPGDFNFEVDLEAMTTGEHHVCLTAEYRDGTEIH